MCHVGDAEVVEAAVRKTVLTGFESRLSLHCSQKRETEGAKRRQRFLVLKTSAPRKARMGVRLLRPPPSAITLKFLIFSDLFTYYINCVIQTIHFGTMPQGTKPACVDTLNAREGP